jgi:protein-S-isoprenylcysteine O-methyltransferase Ste14
METIAARIPAPAALRPPLITLAGLRRALGDCLLAGWFLLAMLPAGREVNFSLAGLANFVWITGAAIMAVMTFARFAPRSATVNLQTIVASGGMMVLPCFMRPINQSSGALATTGLILELLGVTLTQISRIYMGRSFGILPANRGIISNGPFQWIRHPIYLGWLILSIGYATSYVNDRNVILIAIMFALMIWRISQEEAHLSADPEYRGYMDRVRYRLLPSII